MVDKSFSLMAGAPSGLRSRVSGLKGQRPGPLDDRGVEVGLLPGDENPRSDLGGLEAGQKPSVKETQGIQTGVCVGNVLSPESKRSGSLSPRDGAEAVADVTFTDQKRVGPAVLP